MKALQACGGFPGEEAHLPGVAAKLTLISGILLPRGIGTEQSSSRCFQTNIAPENSSRSRMNKGSEKGKNSIQIRPLGNQEKEEVFPLTLDL